MQKIISDLIKINGFIGLEDFIFQAMCHEKYGYYTTKNPLNNDFTTAPEITNAFGIIIGSIVIDRILQLTYCDDIQEINICEFGGGTGKLAFDILSFITNLNKLNNPKINNLIKKINFYSIEFSEKLIEVQNNKLNDIKLPKYFFRNVHNFFEYHKNNSQNKKNINIFLGNEFFDALPIKQFIVNKNDFYEIIITEEKNKLIFSKIKINPDLFPNNYFNIHNMPENSIVEFPNIGVNIFENIINFKSMFITFDYGYLINKYQSTLQGILKNTKTVNILENIGEADITHLVNFELFGNICKKNKLNYFIKTQRDFLLENGIEKLINSENKAGIDRILNNEQMGELFKVLYIDNL